MAPVLSSVNADKRDRSSTTGSTDRRSDLVTRVKYQNTLPDLPFDPKFISYPFESHRFVKYSTTSLEKNFVYEVLTEPDLGVEVELVIPDAYNIPLSAPIPQLDPIDEKLLEDDILPQKNEKRSRHHAKPVSWLRRTEYISTELTRFQPQTIDKVEAKVGYSVKKMLKDDPIHYLDHDAQIRAIEKTFEDSLAPIEEHFSKPGVVPVEILPIFPDFKLWKYPSAQVIFDSDPAPIGRPVPAQLEEMSQAMIRGVMDESGEQFVAYFLPTEETLEKRKKDQENEVEYVDDEVYEYRMAREYNWNVKTKAAKGYEESYYFTMRDDGVFYNELETRVRLSKRRTRGPNQQLNTKLCVKHIPLTTSDYKFQRKREKDLEPIMEDEEDEEEEEEPEKMEIETAEGEKSDAGKSDNEKSDAEMSDKSNNRSPRNKSKSKSRSASPAGSRSRSRSHSGSEGKKSPKKREKSKSGSSSSSSSDSDSGKSGKSAASKSDKSKSSSDSEGGVKSDAKSDASSTSKKRSPIIKKEKSASESSSSSKSSSDSD